MRTIVLGRMSFYPDTAHKEESRPSNGFVIVMDREGIFKRGNSFKRQSFGITLHEAGWPMGMVVRDLVDGMRYEVVEYITHPANQQVYHRQKLRSICGDVELVPKSSGTLRRVDVETTS